MHREVVPEKSMLKNTRKDDAENPQKSQFWKPSEKSVLKSPTAGREVLPEQFNFSPQQKDLVRTQSYEPSPLCHVS